MFLLPLLSLLCIFLSVHAKLEISDGASTIVSVPTQSFFGYSAPAYSLAKGIPIRMRFIKNQNGKCGVKNPSSIPAHSQTGLETVMVAEWAHAVRACGLLTISQFWNLAMAFNATLPAANRPPSHALIVILNRGKGIKLYRGVQGNPLFEAYRSTNIAVTDAVPPSNLNVFILDRKSFMHAKRAEISLRRARKQEYVALVQEPGPWNDVFRSIWYQIIVYLIFAIVCSFLVSQ